jgi:PPOX class probable F420-dependent enzyme
MRCCRASPRRPPADDDAAGRRLCACPRRSYDRPVIDEGTEFGARVARRLREEEVAWVTTVTTSGAPLPRPIWFLWDGADSVLVYSRRGARINNIQANPRVTFNFDGDAHGGDIVVLSGRAGIDRAAPGVDRDDAYLEKYGRSIERTGMSLETFAERFAVPVRIRFHRLYGH